MSHKHNWHITSTFGHKSLQCGCGQYRKYDENILLEQIRDDIDELRKGCKNMKRVYPKGKGIELKDAIVRWDEHKAKDPKRIVRIIKKVEKVWKIAPNLRLGQLLGNICEEIVADTYYITDDNLERYIDETLKKIRKGRVKTDVHSS